MLLSGVQTIQAAPSAKHKHVADPSFTFIVELKSERPSTENRLLQADNKNIALASVTTSPHWCVWCGGRRGQRSHCWHIYHITESTMSLLTKQIPACHIPCFFYVPHQHSNTFRTVKYRAKCTLCVYIRSWLTLTVKGTVWLDIQIPFRMATWYIIAYLPSV